MNKLIFLVLFHGLYGYVFHEIPANNPKQYPINVEVKYYTKEAKIISETVEVNAIVNQIDSTDQESTTPESESPIEKWSVIWYIASFAGLIAFFLIVSCSEWCCRRSARARSSRNNSQASSAPVTPPPSYDQFAPPSYETLNCDRNGEKSEYDVYVVPLHALGTILNSSNRTDDDPPSYLMANDRQLPSQSVIPSGQINITNL